MRKLALFLAILLCLSFTGCEKEKEERIPPTRSTDPILNIEGVTPDDGPVYTPVYVTVFGDTAYLATYPKLEDGEQESPDCPIREISEGGTVSCGGAHEQETPITRVVILEQLHPKSMANWFRNMGALRTIDGLGYLKTENVTDMSYAFTGCFRLVELPAAERWDVSKVEAMTDMFDGCDAMANKPSWYQE